MEGRLISQLPERGLRRELRRHPFLEDATFAILSFILLEKVFCSSKIGAGTVGQCSRRHKSHIFLAGMESVQCESEVQYVMHNICS